MGNRVGVRFVSVGGVVCRADERRCGMVAGCAFGFGCGFDDYLAPRTWRDTERNWLAVGQFRRGGVVVGLADGGLRSALRFVRLAACHFAAGAGQFRGLGGMVAVVGFVAAVCFARIRQPSGAAFLGRGLAEHLIDSHSFRALARAKSGPHGDDLYQRSLVGLGLSARAKLIRVGLIARAGGIGFGAFLGAAFAKFARGHKLFWVGYEKS